MCDFTNKVFKYYSLIDSCFQIFLDGGNLVSVAHFCATQGGFANPCFEQIIEITFSLCPS